MNGEKDIWLETLSGNWVNTKYVIGFNQVIADETNERVTIGEKFYQAMVVTNEHYSISEATFNKFRNYYLNNCEFMEEARIR